MYLWAYGAPHIGPERHTRIARRQRASPALHTLAEWQLALCATELQLDITRLVSP